MGSLVGARSLLMLLLRRHPPTGLFHPPSASSSSAALGPRPPATARFPSLGAPPGPAMPWSHGQIRGKARGNEYQPSNLKRKHKHGWIARIRTASGIRVILRRMLKGRKSLTH